jgi:hypothetical protein
LFFVSITANPEITKTSFQEYDFSVFIASILSFGFQINFPSKTTKVSHDITIASSNFFATSSHLFRESTFASSL